MSRGADLHANTFQLRHEHIRERMSLEVVPADKLLVSDSVYTPS